MEQNVRKFFDSGKTDCAFIMIDVDNFKSVNDEFEKVHNRFEEMVWHEDRDRNLKEIDDLIADNGTTDQCDYRIEKSDGSLCWVHDAGHLVTDDYGKHWFYVTVVDITEMRKAKDSIVLILYNKQFCGILDAIIGETGRKIYGKKDYIDC